MCVPTSLYKLQQNTNFILLYFFHIFYIACLKHFTQPVECACISVYNSVMRNDDSKRKSIQINVRMDGSMADDLRLLAHDLLTTPSQIVRKAVHDYLLKCKKSKKA